MKSKLTAYPYVVWMTIFIAAPLCIVVYFAFTDKSGAFTFENLSGLGRYAPVFVRSILLAAIATVICLVIAYPLSFMLSRLRASSKKLC